MARENIQPTNNKMKTKYIATVHTLQSDRSPIQFVWDTHYLTNGLMSYWLGKDPVAEVPASYLVTYQTITEDPTQEHSMD